MKQFLLAILLILTAALFCAACTSGGAPTQVVITATPEPSATTTQTPRVSPTPTITSTITRMPSSTPTNTPDPAEVVRFDAVVDADVLNLRDAPTVSSEVVAQLEEGEIVRLIGKYGGGEWVKAVTEDQVMGWLYTEFLALQGDLESLVDMDVENGILVSGRVLDSFGNPVNAVQLTLIGEVSQDLISGEDGYFETLLAPGMNGVWEIRIGSPTCESIVMDLDCKLAGYYYYNTSVLIELPDPAAVVFIFNQASGTISGTAHGVDGLPQENLRVVATREDGAESSVFSDADGSFRLPIGPGIWQVRIVLLGEEGPVQEIEIGENQSIVDIVLESP